MNTVNKSGDKTIRKRFDNHCITNKYGSLIRLHKSTDLSNRHLPVDQVRVLEKPPYCFSLCNPPYSTGGERINTISIGVTDCVEYGGVGL